MFSKTTATPSTSQPIRHATTSRDLSALRQTATHSKINFLSPVALKEIQKIAEASIQNKERVDSLMHSMHSAKLNIEALEEKEQNNPNENLLKPKLRDAINKIEKKEKGIKEKISNISKEIQLLQKKQEQQDRTASQREKDFRKHLIDYQSLLKNKKDLEAAKLDLSGNNQVLQRDMNAKMGEVQKLGGQIKSLEESIKEMLEGKVGESYEEMMQASTLLLKKHGMQLLSESTLDELTKYLFKMTDHPSELPLKFSLP